MSKSITRNGPNCHGDDALLEGKLYVFATANDIAGGGDVFGGGRTTLYKTPSGAYFSTWKRNGPSHHTDSFRATALTPEEARVLAFQLNSTSAAAEFGAAPTA